MLTRDEPSTIIVGAGVAGLTCARILHERGLPVTIVETSDAIGGRIQTDVVDGFRLDHGFQVLQTAYPEAQQQLNYVDLQLHPFLPGSLVRFNGRFHRMMDPWRHPWEGIVHSINNPIGTLFDKCRIAWLRQCARRGQIADLFKQPEKTSVESLREYGFSDAMIDRFFRPFLGGIFLERELQTSSRMMHFVFRMLSAGDAALPAMGMQAIPDQLASHIPAGAFCLGSRAASVTSDSVRLEDGRELSASQVVLATSGQAVASLFGQSEPSCRGVNCLYFSADQPPIREPILVLNGESGPINNLCVPSVVAPTYAENDRHLISVTVLEDESVYSEGLEQAVREQARDWFGDAINNWDHLKTYRIEYALPEQNQGRELTTGHALVRDGLILCGDHLGHASIQSALESGRHAAELVLARSLG